MFRALAGITMASIGFAIGTCSIYAQTNSPPDASLTKDTVPVRVDQRVEAMSIIFRLINANEYNQPSSDSIYAKAVTEHFARFARHDTLAMAEKLREERSIGFDAVASFAAHLKDVETCEFLLPLHPWPETLDKRWDAQSAQAFADAVKHFVDDTKFQEFWDSQRRFREIAETRMRELLARKPIKQWIESFFGEAISDGSSVLVGLLNGPANYGSSVRYANGRVLVFPTIGVSHWDSEGMPIFPDSTRATILHEFCHPYVNPLVDQHLNQLLPAGVELQRLRANALAAQAYGQPRTVLYESLVRACVTHLLRANDSKEVGNAQSLQETSLGFLWNSLLAESLERYAMNRDRYPTFRSFMPEIEKVLADPKRSIVPLEQNIPHIIRFAPKNGMNLPVGDVQVQVEFDRPMDRSSRGLSFDVEGGYEVVQPGAFDSEGRLYTVNIRFKPGKVKCWINRNSLGLRDERGYAVDEQAFEFTMGD